MRQQNPKAARALALLAAAAALAGCSKETTPQTDAGVPVNNCASWSQAASNSDCALTSGQGKQGIIATEGDQGWFVLDVPAPLAARSLLSVTASYGDNAKRTPVTLSINVLSADGKSSIGQASADRAHGAYDAQLVTRLAAAGRYFIQVSNASGEDAAKETRFPYTLTATQVSDPDANEPNDDAPAPIALAGCEQDLVVRGAFATSGDRDRFAFDVPSSPCTQGGRTLLYVHAVETAPASSQAVRLYFSLTGPTTAEGDSENRSAGQKAATAIVAPAGKYELRVINRQDASPDPMGRGDLSFAYQITLRLYSDKDPNEASSGNDTLETATNVPLSLSSPLSLTGGLAYRGDQDIYKVVNGTGAPSRLHYKIRSWATSGTPRFEPLTAGVLKVIEVVEPMASQAECAQKCPGGGNGGFGAAWCSLTPARCLWQQRMEDPAHNAQFQNFEGQLHLPPGGTRYLKIWYDGGDGADDALYALELTMLPGRALQDTRASAVAISAGSPATTVLGWGFGRTTWAQAPNHLRLLPTNTKCATINQREECWRVDYDAAAQTDFFKVDFEAGASDRSLGFRWSIAPAAGQSSGSRSYDLGMRFHFCSDSTCSSTVASRFLGYTSGKGYPWYGDKEDLTPSGYPAATPETWFTFDQSAGQILVAPVQCACIDAAYAAAGYFFVEVVAQDRTSYADSQAAVQFDVGSYPGSATDDAGKSFTCPSPCQFVATVKGG